MVELLKWRKEGERRPCVLTCVSLCLKTHGEESHDISVLKKLPCTERCSFGLIGDPKQLAPTVMLWVVARYGYGVSMSERPMYTGGMDCGRWYEPREMRREAGSHC